MKNFKEFKHINDCWSALEEVTTIDEMEDLLEEFPRWSGDWEWYLKDDIVVVNNTWFDKETEMYCDEERELENIVFDLDDFDL